MDSRNSVLWHVRRKDLNRIIQIIEHLFLLSIVLLALESQAEAYLYPNATAWITPQQTSYSVGDEVTYQASGFNACPCHSGPDNPCEVNVTTCEIYYFQSGNPSEIYYQSAPFEGTFQPPAITFDIPCQDSLAVMADMVPSLCWGRWDCVPFQQASAIPNAPVVSVLNLYPTEGATINECKVNVSGKVIDPNVTTVQIYVDATQKTVSVGTDGTFSSSFDLVSGNHAMTITNTPPGAGCATIPQTHFTTFCKTLNFVGPITENDNKVLIHNYDLNAYTSSYQNRIGTDGEIEIEFAVKKDNSTGIEGQDVYFRVIDPDDPSSYETNPSVNDNTGGNKAADIPATLGGAGVTLVPESSPPVWTVKSDTSGTAKVVLQLPGSRNNPAVVTSTPPAPTDNPAAASGDNYLIQASFENFKDNPNPETVVSSGTITAWKRVYIEKDAMFKNGSYVKLKDSVAGSTRIHVVDTNPFKNVKKIEIIHAPRLDGSLEPDAGFFYSETHNVLSITKDSDGTSGGYLELGTFAGGKTTYENLSYDYWSDDSFGNTNFQLSDAVGVITGTVAQPGDLFNVNFPGFVPTLYKDAYVEFVEVSQAAETNYVPYEKLLTGTSREILANKWFRYSDRTGIQGSPAKAKENHQHLIGGSGELNTPTQTYYGDTQLMYGTTNYSWVYIGTIESKFKSADQPNANSKITAHELTHEWYVNHTLPIYINGHCDKKMYNDATKLCGMNSGLTTNDWKNGVISFHYVVSGDFIDSEYVIIRTKTDPVPQSPIP